MGQVVDRRPRRDLTYNTRIGWLILPRPSKNRALLKPRPHLRWCRPRQRSVQNANLRRKAIVRKVAGEARRREADKDRVARAAGREIAKAEVARTVVDAKVADPIEEMTGVAAIAAASKARPKSISRS